ncbi:MAG TPA: hypothetical protein VFJ90_10980, partial [Candidatus Didemnitutus sp.]|nr:hypothetical protein [Candidatus Didemnitutus sp.]
KLASLSLLTAAALSLAPKPPQAGDKEAAIIGGMILGGIVGAVIANNTHDVSCEPAPVVTACPTTSVVYTSAPVVYAPTPVVIDPCAAGYWNEVRVQVFVPGRWSVRYDCGRQVRYYAAGHYEWRTNRVWVANNNRHDGHHDRQVSQGYGRGRDDHGNSRGRDDRNRR